MVTIKDIAERAGVSIGTVDRVLHNRGRVSAEKEAQIRAIIKEFDYKPNLFARQLKLSRKFTFGVLMPKPEQDGNYWKLPKLGIDEAVRELSSQKIAVQYFYFDKNHPVSFQMEGEKLLRANVDGIVVSPQFADCCVSLIRKLRKDIPAIFIDTPLQNVQPLSFIGQDAFQSGVVSAKLMQGLVHGKADVAVIRPRPLDLHIEQRIEGFLSFLGKNTSVASHVYDVDCCEDRDDFSQVVTQLISELDLLKGIFVANARTYQVAEVVVKHGMDQKIQIIGYDLVPQNLKFLETDVIDYLISQTPRQQGYRAIYALYRHFVLQEPVAEKIMMPIDIITKENVAYYSG